MFTVKIYIYGKVKVYERHSRAKSIECKDIFKYLGNIFFSDFGVKFPSDWLYDGFKMSPDFTNDTKMLSYSGTREFKSNPNFSLQTSYHDSWKISSPF